MVPAGDSGWGCLALMGIEGKGDANCLGDCSPAIDLHLGEYS